MKKSKKGDIEMDTLIPWILAIVILVVIVVGYLVFRGKGTGALDFIKNLFRFGK